MSIMHLSSDPADPTTCPSEFHSTPSLASAAQTIDQRTREATPLIECLPPELLAEVFVQCIAQDAHARSALRQVSRGWRDVVYSFPKVWQYLAMDEQPSFDSQRLCLEADMWSTWSRTMPLDFDITFDTPDTVLPMLSYMLPAVGRWREGTFIGPGSSRLLFGFCDDDNKPNLDALHLSITNSENTDQLDVTGDLDLENADLDDDWNEVKATSHRFDNRQGRLTSMYLTLFTLPPPKYMMPLRAMTTLTIANYDFDGITLHDVLAFLSFCPVLESFGFSNVLYQEAESPEDCNGVPMTSLPRLSELRLISVCTTRCFLSHVVTPALDALSLIHVNSALRLALPDPSEAGDSEDEAHDFSQSPWTDHATGMGLRRLFTRSDPPLRVLNMDYADLRTKDFKWAFGRFDSLVSLRVVASDMSDNVVRALQPAEKWLPLPLLSELELNQCQKLSGESIEEMVKSRLEAAEKGLITRMVGLTIENCVGFTAVHYQGVARVFKPRSGFVYIS